MSEVNNGQNVGAVVVPSTQSVTEIVKSGGVLMPTARVNWRRIHNTVGYVVCCNPTSGDGFLLGKISKVQYVNDQCVLQLDSYAEISKPDLLTDNTSKYGYRYVKNLTAIHLRAGYYTFKAIDQYKAERNNVAAQALKIEVEKPEVKKPIVVTQSESTNLATIDVRDVVAKIYGLNRNNVKRIEIDFQVGDAMISVKL